MHASAGRSGCSVAMATAYDETTLRAAAGAACVKEAYEYQASKSSCVPILDQQESLVISPTTTQLVVVAHVWYIARSKHCSIFIVVLTLCILTFHCKQRLPAALLDIAAGAAAVRVDRHQRRLQGGSQRVDAAQRPGPASSRRAQPRRRRLHGTGAGRQAAGHPQGPDHGAAPRQPSLSHRASLTTCALRPQTFLGKPRILQSACLHRCQTPPAIRRLPCI